MRLWYFPFLILAPLAVVAAQQREIVVPATGEYKTQRGKVKLLGVCRFMETDAICWDAAGKPDQRLSSEVLDSYKKGRLSAKVHYGRKSRFLVFQMPNERSDGFSDTESFRFTEENFDRLSYSSPEKPVGLIERSTRLETKFCDVLASHSRPMSPSERFPVREGTKFKFGGLTYSIVKVGKREDSLEGRPGPSWTIACRVEGSPQLARYMGFSVVGQDGSVVRRVDPNGNPIIAAPNRRGYVTSGQPDPSVLDAYLITGGLSGPETLLTTNIDPAKIKEAFATGSESTRVRFTEIPLEPK